MYKNEELMRIKRRLREGVDDMVLGQCYDDAQAAICDYCNRNEVPDTAAGLLRELTMLYYSRNGRAEEVSRSEGAISVSYSTEDIPAGIKSRLSRYRLLKAVNIANASPKS